MRQFTYAVKLTPDKRDGGYVVTCRDMPEIITQGDTVEEAVAAATDALEEAVAGRIDDKRDIPVPTARRRGESMYLRLWLLRRRSTWRCAMPASATQSSHAACDWTKRKRDEFSTLITPRSYRESKRHLPRSGGKFAWSLPNLPGSCRAGTKEYQAVSPQRTISSVALGVTSRNGDKRLGRSLAHSDQPPSTQDRF